ncbi:hypothetical protein B0H13DRAFT_2341665 [Mycena leptocephala]|nr:hypothetical protein B0H13DRAFT_2374955 [Mycena leptocephala]KAJ7889216.1 hypothetical protein B0H13DRAFT_2341665 [Mycena leptocephala]
MVFQARMLSSLAALAAIVMSCAGQSSIDCFGIDGAMGDCTSFIPIFCASLGIKTIAPADTAARCFNMPNGVRCDFDAVNIGGATDIPSIGNCQTLLTQVSASCPSGGVGNILGQPFEFFVDPNTGPCEVFPPGN